MRGLAIVMSYALANQYVEFEALTSKTRARPIYLHRTACFNGCYIYYKWQASLTIVCLYAWYAKHINNLILNIYVGSDDETKYKYNTL